MNRMYPINYSIQTSAWGVFKYSIILNIKKTNINNKLTNISTF